MKKILLTSSVFTALSMGANAVELSVTLTNLTQGMTFTPRLLVAHTAALDLFEPGTTASTPLAWVAEAGVIGDTDNEASAGNNFESVLNAPENADLNAWQAFGGLLAPATTSAVYTFETDDHAYLSMVAMLIPTNDAFVGLDSIKIPTEPGTYRYDLNAYDAGTELNDEINPATSTATEAGTGNALGGYGVPGFAGAGAASVSDIGSGATGVSAEIDGNNEVMDGTDGPVHIHRGVLGDLDSTAGKSDLDASVHRWLNPVARITIVVPAQ